MQNETIITDFIEHVWNKGDLSKLDQFLHPDYQDFSLPPAMPANGEGLVQWVRAMNYSFRHKTIIDDIVANGDKIMLRVRMELKHTGNWREIPATGAEVTTPGFRFFRLKDGRIIEHRALLDAEVITRSLSTAYQAGAKA